MLGPGHQCVIACHVSTFCATVPMLYHHTFGAAYRELRGGDGKGKVPNTRCIRGNKLGSWSSRATYIRMSPNLLNDLVIKVSRIAQKVAGNVVGVLQALKELCRKRKLRTLSQL